MKEKDNTQVGQDVGVTNHTPMRADNSLNPTAHIPKEKGLCKCGHHWSVHHRKRRKNSWKLTQQERCYEKGCKCKKYEEEISSEEGK